MKIHKELYLCAMQVWIQVWSYPKVDMDSRRRLYASNHEVWIQGMDLGELYLCIMQVWIQVWIYPKVGMDSRRGLYESINEVWIQGMDLSWPGMDFSQTAYDFHQEEWIWVPVNQIQ